ncbi:alpha-E domain-containing protein [Allorhizocola rhizosphaerae]|uniref:alpha-E domain-containing protein n=1 Tax=Allorhizocola rhizosphaerae TaxID=1872709 RepID=UPI001B8C566C|nr:alpha-E domain-containing protein [Allorhizocola rhizosphaerae]
MLSRIAESLFWIGRYVERADDTARILDAFLARMLEDPWADENAACRSMLAILGFAPHTDGRLTTGDALEILAFDRHNASSITGALASARENARGARETISSEMWECLNVTWHSLAARRKAAERLGPHLFLGFVRERAAVLAGLAESTMSRDDTWRFLVLGRSLERVDMTARQLSIQAGTPQWRTVLKACGADESFLRTHGGEVKPQRVVEFLLLDRLFPRSALHALTTAEDCLRALTPGVERAGVTDPARRPIGQARTRLEYADMSTLLDDLPEHLAALQRACAAASAAVTARFFVQAAAVAWALEDA